MAPVFLAVVALAAVAALVAADGSLYFNSNKQFKIVQFADMHYSNGQYAVPCSDILPEQRPCSDLNTTAFMAKVLDAEQPDLVLFSGDNIIGSAISAVNAITAYSKPVVDRQIPWAVVFGNHDDESIQKSRAEQMEIVRSLPYAYSEHGPTDVTGVGNYVINVYAENSTQNGLNIYFIDSGAYSKVRDVDGYDWIHPSQLNWFLQKSAAIKANNGGVTVPAFAVHHIPTQEWELVTDFVGDKYENVADPGLNSGFFTAVKEAGDVRAIFVGHDHVNAGCGTYYGVRLCYPGGVGYGTYGRAGWPRRSRVILIEENGATANTWLRLDDATLSTHLPQPLY